jgi:transposase
MGPNPTDRARPGSKHHLITEAQGIPLAVSLTGANRHDITQLHALADAIPPIGGKPDRPLSKPRVVRGDRGYDHDKSRRPLHAAGIAIQMARRGQPHSSGRGKSRWVVERTISWLHNFRRLPIRVERLTFIHEAFMKIACYIICWRGLKNSFFKAFKCDDGLQERVADTLSAGSITESEFVSFRTTRQGGQ